MTEEMDANASTVDDSKLVRSVCSATELLRKSELSLYDKNSKGKRMSGSLIRDSSQSSRKGSMVNMKLKNPHNRASLSQAAKAGSEALSICKNILNGIMDPVSDLVPKMNQEEQEDFAQHLLSFFSLHDKTRQLFEWVLSCEIASSRHYNLLFREDSIYKMIINRVLFGEMGTAYLTKILKPLMKSLKQSSKTRDDEAAKTRKTQAAVDVFLRNFVSESSFCPLEIRELVSLLQSKVDETHGSQVTDTPFGLNFIFFNWICPALVNPQKYNITTKKTIPSHLAIAYIRASKLLKDISTKAPRDEAMNVYIASNYPTMYSHFTSLIDRTIIDRKRTEGTNRTTLSKKREMEKSASGMMQDEGSMELFHFVESVVVQQKIGLP
eukprot:TRINITY_DN4809_c0_g2_i1.p1 TRINITY_DN4809_c0_g2~~TRINITY_DN4809_c0_g2_i1.p1  ORF type:complete len:381 (-),score=100.60 TRINITY_DN4809_c0_g2_i1:159-1301(-)